MVTASSSGSSQTFSGGSCGTADDDVWFRFTATATSHTVRVTPSNSFDPSMQTYFNASCSSLISTNNITTCANSSSGTVLNQQLTGLTVGNTYFVRVWHWSSTPPSTPTFDICVITPPTNDEPCNAVLVTPNAAQRCAKWACASW